MCARKDWLKEHSFCRDGAKRGWGYKERRTAQDRADLGSLI